MEWHGVEFDSSQRQDPARGRPTRAVPPIAGHSRTTWARGQLTRVDEDAMGKKSRRLSRRQRKAGTNSGSTALRMVDDSLIANLVCARAGPSFQLGAAQLA